VHQRDVPIDYGVVRLDGATICGYDEKPTLSYQVSMGVYVFERTAIQLVPRGQHFDFPDLVHRMLEDGLAVHAHLSSAFWLDIGRPEDYELANRRFEELRDELFPAG
jgi:NDP-mannose synthase